MGILSIGPHGKVCQGMTGVEKGAFQGPSSWFSSLIELLDWKPKHSTVLGGGGGAKRKGDQVVGAGRMGGSGKEGQQESSGAIHAGGGFHPWFGSPEPPARMSLLT